jgi:hypothetical protein
MARRPVLLLTPRFAFHWHIRIVTQVKEAHRPLDEDGAPLPD